MKKLTYKIVMVLFVAWLISFAAITGCKKSEPLVEDHSTHEHAMSEVAEESAEAATDVIEQKLCPIMKNPINKSLFTEYKGQKVYFCCAGCVDKFNADPEKYLQELPQFRE